jgi:hypothetical protein
VTTTTPPPPVTATHGTTGTRAQAVPGDACPLCNAPLHREQEWCLRCGAAARTRLAAAPNWRVPIAALLAVVALSLGVLTAALVDLAGSSSSSPAITRTITTAPPAAPTGPAGTPLSTVPGTTTPGAATPGATTPGAVTPGATTPSAPAPATTTPVTPTTKTPSTVAPGTTAPK